MKKEGLLFMLFSSTQTKHEPSQVSVVNYILKNSMKRNVLISNCNTIMVIKSICFLQIINIHLAAERFMSLILPLQLKNPLQLEKLDWDSEILELGYSQTNHYFYICNSVTIQGLFLEISKLDLDKKREIYLTIQDAISELSLDNVWDEKPLMSGGKIIEEVQKGGQVTAKQDRGPIIRLTSRC
ncbi:hypothetical protein HID58_083673 [Brassica napus]|uniref:Uncharacterized protein n=1 Tax=Brassica napus TaxID=3708 RepID=A0ABQ7YE77_BRANA|nr:hypothetical protein HID58_083673 [Brassica napus]